MYHNRRFRTGFVALLVVTISLFVITGALFAQGGWGYEDDNGPDVWADLSSDYAACGEGMAQSPIDLTEATTTSLTPITFEYEEVPMAVFNNGHTIEVEYEEGSYIVYNEKHYDVLQFHFHQPSEHTLDGQSFPMELHIVHRSESGGLAVIGVMMAEGDEPNTAYATLFDNLPAEVSEPDEETTMTINVADLLPADTDTFYTYEGSLTTPPCSEIVRWLVLAEPVYLSADQIAAFGSIYDHNARPVQPLNERDLFTNQG